MTDTETKIKWFAVLPQALIKYGDIFLDLSQYDDILNVFNSFRKQLETSQPNVIVEHENAHQSYGSVEEVSILSLAEATAKGLDQKSPNMIYLGVSELVEGDLERAEYASVGLCSDVTDENGVEWEWWLSELSITGMPHIRHEQTRSSKIHFSDNSKTYFLSARGYKMESQAPAPAPAPALADTALITQLQKEVERLTAELAKTQKERDDLLANQLEMEAEEEVEELEEEVEELELSARLRSELITLYKRDKAAFRLAASGIRATGGGRRSRKINFSARASRAGGSSPMTPEQRFARASEYRTKMIQAGDKNFTFKAALKAVGV